MDEAQKVYHTARLKPFYVEQQISHWRIYCNIPSCSRGHLGNLFLHHDLPAARTEVRHPDRYRRDKAGLFHVLKPTQNTRYGLDGQRKSRRPRHIDWVPELGDDNTWRPGRPSHADLRQNFDGEHPKPGDSIVCPACKRPNVVPAPPLDGA